MAVFNPTCNTAAQTETLAGLRVRVLQRLGFGLQTANPPPGMAALVDEFLRSAQTQLYRRYPELETERWFTWTTVVGERFYNLATNDEQAGTELPICDKTLDVDRITWVGIEDENFSWYTLTAGIEPLRYTLADRLGLPDSYEIRQALEIFPAPDSANYKVRIKGHFGLLTFVADTDVTTIDPELVFLLALANAKSHYQQTDAQLYFTQATNYLGLLTAAQHNTQRYVPGTMELLPETRPVLLPLP